MVGREHELASLIDGLDDAASRRGRLFLVCGEPGVGKTRLSDEVAGVAEAKRMALMVGHCSERDEAVAYLPFVEILESFVERPQSQDRLRAALGPEASELERLLPTRTFSGASQLRALSPAQARRHLLNSFFDFAARAASSRPALMILEISMGRRFALGSARSHRAASLGSVVDGYLPLSRCGDEHHAVLARTLEDLVRGRLATEVRLKRLPRGEVGAMLSRLSGKPPPESIVAEIFAETEGNPFFVEELFHHLEDEGRLYDAAGQFRSKLQIGEFDAPRSVRLVVARRLSRLGQLTGKILAAASVIGRFFSFEVLKVLYDDKDDSILECLEEAEKAGLLVSVTTGSQARFAFSHELIRQAVLSGLSAMRRQRLHLKVAGAIEQMA